MIFKVLVCGGRDWLDYVATYAALDALPHPPTLIIHGGAKGADSTASDWAWEKGIHTARVAALWNVLGRSAGHLRNASMLQLTPDYCVAFPGGRGTAGMVKLLEAAGVPVWRPYGV